MRGVADSDSVSWAGRGVPAACDAGDGVAGGARGWWRCCARRRTSGPGRRGRRGCRSCGWRATLRSRVARHLRTLPLNFFTQSDPDEAVAKTTQDLTLVEDVLTQGVDDLAGGLAQVASWCCSCSRSIGGWRWRRSWCCRWRCRCCSSRRVRPRSTRRGSWRRGRKRCCGSSSTSSRCRCCGRSTSPGTGSCG